MAPRGRFKHWPRHHLIRLRQNKSRRMRFFLASKLSEATVVCLHPQADGVTLKRKWEYRRIRMAESGVTSYASSENYGKVTFIADHQRSKIDHCPRCSSHFRNVPRNPQAFANYPIDNSTGKYSLLINGITKKKRHDGI